VWNYGVTSIWTWRYRREDRSAKRRMAASEASVQARSVKSGV
jgi:hypothetical protein